MNTTLINGISSHYLNIDDRAIHYGDGIFETLLCNRQSAAKWQCYYWQQHYHRLRKSAEKLKIACPDEALLLSDIKTLLDATGQDKDSRHQNRVIKIILTRGSSERGYLFPDRMNINRIAISSPLAADYSSLASAALLGGELTVCVQQASINEQLAGIKHLNRLENVLARNEWNRQGYSGHRHKNNNFIEGLMLDADGFIIEGTMSNLFMVKDEQILTPALTRAGVEGIMRSVIIDIADSKGMTIKVRNITLEEIDDMDEIFITNSLIGLKSICGFSHMLSGSLQERILPKQAFATQLLDELLKTKNTYATTL